MREKETNSRVIRSTWENTQLLNFLSLVPIYSIDMEIRTAELLPVPQRIVGSWMLSLSCRGHWPSHFYQMVGESWSSWHTTILCYIVVFSNTYRELHEFGQHHLLLDKSESMGFHSLGLHYSALKIKAGFAHWEEGINKCIDESRPWQKWWCWWTF